jgi:hypothetical protein
MAQLRSQCIFAAVAALLAAAPAGAATLYSFERDIVGQPPEGFEFAVTAKSKPGKWVVVREGENKVLAQTDRDRTARRFAIALAGSGKYRNVKVSVRAKPVGGDVEKVAGLVWRYQDADNYYVARWNDNSVRVDRVVKGERQPLTQPKEEIPMKIDAKAWQTMTVQHFGDAIKVTVAGKTVFEGKDKAYSQPGRVGVWTKADSQTLFDDLSVEELK